MADVVGIDVAVAQAAQTLQQLQQQQAALYGGMGAMYNTAVENGAVVNKMTNMTYAVIVHQFQLLPGFISSFYFMED